MPVKIEFRLQTNRNANVLLCNGLDFHFQLINFASTMNESLS